MPARITIMNKDGILQTVSSSSAEQPGDTTGRCIHCDWESLTYFSCRAYKIYVGRGFEYGIFSAMY